MADPKFSADDARALLASIGQIHLCAIHPNGIGIQGQEFGDDVTGAIEWACATNGNGYNVYWTVNPTRPGLNKKATKADILAARFTHVDIDPPKTGGAFDKGAVIAGLSGIDAPPSFIIDSGGGLQAFWRLDGPCANLDSIEGINRQIRDYCEADACWNIDRLMRLPGSVNWPDAKKRARGRAPALAKFAVPDDGTLYGPEELHAAFPAETGGQGDGAQSIAVHVNAPDDVTLETPDSLGMGPACEMRAALIAPPGEDRSGDGVAAARLMANAGYSDAQIMGALLNPANAVSAHYLAQRDCRRAAIRTLRLIRSDGPQDGDLPNPQTPVMSQEQFDTFVQNSQREVQAQMVPVELGGEALPANDTLGDDWLDDLGDNPLAQFVRHVTATAASPQPWVTLGAALAVFGTAAGRRYASPSGLRTNIYAIGICDSGGGKDWPIKCAQQLLVDAGLQAQMGGSKIASGQAMLTDLTRSPALLYAIDEVGFLISSAADRKRAPKHATEIIDNMTALYSMAGGTFLGTSYANQDEKPRQVIEQPCLSLFGVTTPNVFWGSLSSANVADGSLARMVIFESPNNYPDPQFDITRRGFPAMLVHAVQACNKGATGHDPFPMGESNTQPPRPYAVPCADDEARAMEKAIRLTQIDLLRKNEGSNLTSVIARLAENAIKIALIRAVCANPLAPVITKADYEWGMRISRKSVDALMKAVREQVADNEQEENVKKVLHVILQAGEIGITRSDLGRKVRKISPRMREEIVRDLIMTHEIFSFDVGDGVGGRTGSRYVDYKYKEKYESAGLGKG